MLSPIDSFVNNNKNNNNNKAPSMFQSKQVILIASDRIV